MYLCRCGQNLASHLDLDAIARALGSEPGAGGLVVHDTLCTPQGQAFLISDLRASGAERFAIVGCSVREHEATFRSACRAAGLNRRRRCSIRARKDRGSEMAS